MPYLLAAVVLVGAVGMLNLILMLGVLRRLREHGELLARPGSGGSGADSGLLAAGETIGEFRTRTVDGGAISHDDLTRDMVVAFFSPHCQPCKDLLPTFVEYAGHAGGRGRIVAVVSGDRSETADMATALVPVARVLTDDDARPLVGAFSTTGYPAIYVMGENGIVAGSGHSMSVLPSFAAA